MNYQANSFSRTHPQRPTRQSLTRRQFLTAGAGAAVLFPSVAQGALAETAKKPSPPPRPPIEQVTIQDRRLRVNGEPFLALGVYHAAHWHHGHAEAGAQGFNLLYCFGSTPEELRADLDQTYAHGMYGLVALVGLCEDIGRVEQLVRGCRDHPGLLAWSLEDEPNIRLPEPADQPYAERPFRLPPEKLQPVSELIHRLDPRHPVHVNLCHGWLKDHQAYAPVAEVMSADIYPVPESALPSVAAYADVTVQGGEACVPWLVLQMAPVRPHLREQDRPPTMIEVRCMTYLALAHGITGLLYYSFNERPGYEWRIPETAPALWAQYADLTAELRTLAPALLAPSVPEPVAVSITQGPAGPGPWNYPPLHTSLRRTETGWFLIAVNGLAEPVTAELPLPIPTEKLYPQAAVRFEHRLVEVKDGMVTDSFEPYGVHLYDLRQPV